MSEVVNAHIPCPYCGSHDAAALYDDGHTYCFSCHHTEFPQDETEARTTTRMKHEVIPHEYMEFRNLKARGLSATTCERYNYYVTQTRKFGTVQVAEYLDDNCEVLFQKIRTRDKKFMINGTTENRFFGQHLFQGGGKKLVITEGEIDCLTVSQMGGNKWPVVSLPHGCGSAKKCFTENLDWLESFEEVIVMFDMDKQGRKACEDVQGILSPHKLKIADLPEKDANACLVAGKGDAIIRAIFDAKEYRPDGIVNAADIEDAFFADDAEAKCYTYPWCKGLNSITKGLRKGELVMLTAGTGIGKSTAAREIAYKLKVKDNLKVGLVFLEENPKKTLRELLSIHVEKPLSILWGGVDKEKLRQSYEELFSDKRFVLYDHFGSIESNNLLARIRYLAVAEQCDFIIFDHVSIAVSGMDEGLDERKTIDKLMTNLRSLVEETGVGMIVISHLKKTNADKSFEEGGIISLDDLRGSGTLKQLPDEVLALERDQQAEDESERNMIKIRVLKNRFAGSTGLVGYLHWNKDRHRLLGEEQDESCAF